MNSAIELFVQFLSYHDEFSFELEHDAGASDLVASSKRHDLQNLSLPMCLVILPDAFSSDLHIC
jgi:hypothetical protein